MMLGVVAVLGIASTSVNAAKEKDGGFESGCRPGTLTGMDCPPKGPNNCCNF